MGDESPLTEPAAWPWRLPIVRHIRFLWLAWRVARFQQATRGIGIRTGFDERVLRQIWRGIV